MTSRFFFSRPAAAFAAVPLLTLLLLTSCVKNHNYNDNGNAPVSEIMAFNLSPDKSSIGFSLSGNSLTNSPLGYGNYTGNYLNIYPGDRTVNAYDFYTSSVVYASVPGVFATSKFYSLFFTGVNNNYKNILVQDNYDSLSGVSGKAYVRYINAIPDSLHALNVTVSSGGTPALVNDAAFGSVSPFTEINSGDISVAIKNTNGVDTTRIISLEEKKVYTILLSGISGSASTPVQIKYITNGTLPDAAAGAAGITNKKDSVN